MLLLEPDADRAGPSRFARGRLRLRPRQSRSSAVVPPPPCRRVSPSQLSLEERSNAAWRRLLAAISSWSRAISASSLLRVV